MLNTIDNLIKEVAVNTKALAEAKKKVSARYAPDFRIMNYLRDDEVGLSYCLATLLDPDGKHGQNELYLRLFCNHFLNKLDWLPLDGLSSASVLVEKQTFEQRRIDIFAEIRDIGVIGIENKPWASDQVNQLTDYACFLSKLKRNWVLLYLSNHEPSSISIPEKTRTELEQKNNFRIISFNELAEWLRECLNNTRPPALRIFIEELMKYIKEQLNGERDMDNTLETRDIILNHENNIPAAFEISSALLEVKRSLLEKLKNQLELSLSTIEFKGQLEWNLNADDQKRWSGFYIHGEQLSQFGLCLGFEFDHPLLNSLYWGLKRNKDNMNLDQFHVERAKQFTPDTISNGSKNDSNEIWGWWTSDFKPFNLSPSDGNWQNNGAPWRTIRDGTFGAAVCEIWSQINRKVVDYKIRNTQAAAHTTNDSHNH